jgi:hypothetical protein
VCAGGGGGAKPAGAGGRAKMEASLRMSLASSSLTRIADEN